MYRKILVPYDGSRYSKKAFNEALKIAQLAGSVIYLCTVVNANVVIPPGALLGMVKTASRSELHKKIVSKAKSEAEITLKELVKECKSKNIEARYKVIIDGNIAEQILKAARSCSADLIVVGSQGLHGIGRIKSLGSVSRKIAELATKPVLIVR